MPKSHRDFCIYIRGGIAINALVAVSRDVVTPATQTEPAKSVEHLTLVYLSPDSARPIMSGDQLRNSVKFEFDVPPLVDGGVNGWKDVIAEVTAPSDIAQGSGSEKYGASDWTAAGQDSSGFPVPKGSPEDVTTAPTSSPKDAPLTNTLPTESEAIAAAQVADAVVLDDTIVSGPDGLTDHQRGYKWGSEEHKRVIGSVPPAGEFVEVDPAIVAAAGLGGHATGPEGWEKFKTGEKVRFTPESGNDTTPVYTINGGEVGQGDDAQWFWCLNEITGLFLGSNLASAE